MAKSNALRSGERSHIRFIMLDADLNEGELNQVTQAIQNALAPANRNAPLRLASPVVRTVAADEDRTGTDEVLDAETGNEIVDAPMSDAPRSNRVRKHKTPNVIPLDMDSDPTLADFAKGKKTDSDAARFLVIASWLKEHRNLPAITADHIYTCLRRMSWPTNIKDFTQPLRNLKHQRLFDLTEHGYAINHVGLAKVIDAA